MKLYFANKAANSLLFTVYEFHCNFQIYNCTAAEIVTCKVAMLIVP